VRDSFLEGPLRPALALSFLVHLCLAFLLFNQEAPVKAPVLKVRMVHLSGTQARKAGWNQKAVPKPAAKNEPAKAAPKPAAKTEPAKVVPKPAAKTEPAKAVPKPAAKTEPAKVVPKPTAKTEPAKAVPKPAAKTEPAKVVPKPTAKTEPAKVVPKPAAKTEPIAQLPLVGGGLSQAQPGESQDGLHVQGAQSDGPEFPGLSAYLRRLQGAIQRAFRYPGQGSGAAAQYHFFVDQRGQIRGLEMTQSSGAPGMDLAAQSAIRRATLPPLPASFSSPELGITFTFTDH
jgi:TonB family protein